MRICSLDFETTISAGTHGPSWRDPSNDFCTVIWSTDGVKSNILHNASGFGRRLPDKCLEDIMSSNILVGHNLPFDLGYCWGELKEFVRKGGLVWDCQVAQYLLSGQRHSFASLGEVQEIYLGSKVKDSKIGLLYKKGIGADKIIAAQDRCKRIWQRYELYANNDGTTPIQVMRRQYAEAKQKNMINIIKIYNLYMLALVETMSNGILVDVRNTEFAIRELRTEALALQQKAQDSVSKMWVDERLPPFNINSSLHKSVILFGGGIPVKVKKPDGFYKNGNPKTKVVQETVRVDGFGLETEFTRPAAREGIYSTDKSVVINIANNCTNQEAVAYCNYQRDAAQIEKVVGTYLTAFLSLSVNGYLYPHYNNTRTASGRLSSSKPNFQNLISKGPMVRHVKSKLIAPEGWVCVSVDYSQLELYIDLWLSGDKNLYNTLIVDKKDIHCQTLAQIENMPYEDVYRLCKVEQDAAWDAKRSKAKGATYQQTYGAAAKSIAASTGMEVEEAQEVIDALLALYPESAAFNESVYNIASSNLSPSLAKLLPAAKKRNFYIADDGTMLKGKQFYKGIELIPILKFYGDPNPKFVKCEYRHFGTYQSKTGKLYCFDQYAQMDKFGNLNKGISRPQTKNYPKQGTAADVVAMASVELMYFSLGRDDVKLVNQVHDSIEFYVKKDSIDVVISAICTIMEDVPKLTEKYLNLPCPFKFKVDVEVGGNFFDMHSYNKEGRG